jgi:hypothetical protein
VRCRGESLCAFGVSGQILDHLGYCVTVVAGEASEPYPCLNADEKLNALLRAMDAGDDARDSTAVSRPRPQDAARIAYVPPRRRQSLPCARPLPTAIERRRSPTRATMKTNAD